MEGLNLKGEKMELKISPTFQSCFGGVFRYWPEIGKTATYGSIAVQSLSLR